MDFYFIPPLDHLDLMHHGDRYFCLAQLYRKSSEYRDFFKARVSEGKWVTLDNGAGDHDMVDVKTLLEIVDDLAPSEVIPPDTLHDGIATIFQFEDFMRGFFSNKLFSQTEIFACPQGRTHKEWLFVYEYFLKHPFVNTIGLSKIAVPKVYLNKSNDEGIKEARHMCVMELSAQNLLQKPIHLLGAGDMREFKLYKQYPLIRSNDSCNAIWSGVCSVDFAEGNFVRYQTPKSYFDLTLSERELQVAESNIQWVKNNMK